MRSIVGCETYYLYFFASIKVLRKIAQILHCCPSKPVEGLILVTNHANIVGLRGQPDEYLLLDIICVLVLIDKHITNIFHNKS